MINQFFRYGLLSVTSYFMVIAGTFVMVEWVKVRESYSYMVVLALVYVFVFLANNCFVFQVKPTRIKAVKYLIFLAVFWLINSITFSIMVEYIGMEYFIAIIINIAVLGAFRFYINKKIIFVN